MDSIITSLYLGKLQSLLNLPRWIRLPAAGIDLEVFFVKIAYFDSSYSANLSNDYFTNRQDRYMEIYNHTPLADYFVSLLSTISSLSFLVTSSNSSTTNAPLNITWPESNITSSPLDSKTSIPEFNQIAHEAFTKLTSVWANKGPNQLNATFKPTLTPTNQIYDTSIRPILQIGPFKITQETDLTVPTILKTANSLATAPGGAETKIDWTSGYFSLRKGYREGVLECKAGIRIVCASPESNGFFGSKGVSRFIPPAYTFFEKNFYEESVNYSQRRRKENHVDMREWKREGWTYHAKGTFLILRYSYFFC